MPAVKLDPSEYNELVDVGKTKAQDLPGYSQRRIEFHLARKPFSSSPNTRDFQLVTLNPSTSSLPNGTLPSSSATKPSPSDFVDSALDTELAYHIPFRRIGAGLENLGNTCYLNSVLQCLTYTEPLVAYLQNGKHQYTCHTAGFCALCAIHKHTSHALQSTGRILAPKDLVSNLRCISRNFRNARQEDAHEYMIHLLESMHKCCLPSGVPSESPGAYEKSLVYKIFGGRLRSQVKCLQCSYCSNTFDPFLDLSLEIVKADSLYKALAHFTAAEQLDDGERQYRCERCKQKVKAVKQLTVYKAPYVLGIHLKRFRSQLAEKKIDKKVYFDSTLDLKPFVSGAYEGDMMYKLYGVLVHAGWSTRSGHYYCFVRTSSGLWYSLDDRRVAQVSERTVLEQKAYMLFYVRDRMNIPPKKAMDVVQKENLMTIFQTSSSSCSFPGAKIFKHDCADNSSTRMASSGFIMKDSGSSKASEALVRHKTSESAIQPINLSGNSKDADAVCVKVKINPEKAMDAQKENLMTASQNASRSCSIPGAKVVQNDCADKNSARMMTSGFLVKDSESCKPSKIPVQQNISDSAVQPSSDSNIHKDGELKPMMDTRSTSSKYKHKLTNSKGSAPMKLSRDTLHRKLVKKILKSRAVGMHLSTKILYGASLSLSMRRKFRRKKQSQKNVMHKQLLNKDVVSINTGPSTSNIISDSKGGCMDSQKNGSNPCSREGEKVAANKRSMYCGSKPSIMNPVRELEDRTTCSNVKLPQEGASCSLEADHVGFGDSSYAKQPNSLRLNGVKTAVARGQEEIAVGRWEGIEFPEILESNSQTSFSMGYVLDTWDEEYDRGKRKKSRVLRNGFGGPNPFQEIAVKKAKLKATTGAAN